MQKKTFNPWVGENYNTIGLYGIKILFLGESHYGKKGTESKDTTINVIKRLALCEEKCHRFFTIIAKFALLKGKARISKNERNIFWQQVSFYNYVQEFVSNKARKRPSDEMWKSSEKALFGVIDILQPDLIVVLGKELDKHLPSLPNNIEICRVNHPSSGFKYDDWIPKFKESLSKLGISDI